METSDRFLLLGEPLALDLVNTRIHRNGVEVDLLGNSDDLAAWLHSEHERVPWTGKVTAADLRALKAMRDCLAELFRALRTQTQPLAPALQTLNRILTASPPRPRLQWSVQGPSLAPLGQRNQRQAFTHALAEDAVALITGPHAGQLRKCAHPDCILQFVATNPRRRWCASATCGNRARVAQHYQRQRDPGATATG